MSETDDLPARNRAALERRAPEAARALDGLGPPVTRPVTSGGRVVNVDLGGGTLYPAPAPEWTARQLDDYFAAPDRVVAPDPADYPLPPEARALRADLDAFLTGRGEPADARFPVSGVGFAFVFGIGLGHHLRPLLERTGCRRMILVEPVAEFLHHSLAAIDWADLFAVAEARGARIEFCLDPDPAAAVRRLEWLLLRDEGRHFVDGSYAYVHYPSWPTRTARALLNERIGNFLTHPSFLADEALMMENAFANLSRRTFALLERRPWPVQPLPAIIVGSGPSLDRDLEHLRRLRGRAVVISCGSALSVLLRNGMRPDLHLENENSRPLVDNLRRLAAEHDLSDIRLVASTTVDPDATGIFPRNWLYFRSTLSPSVLLNDRAAPLIHTGPMVANAALSVALTLGFRRLVLFGVDCGRRAGAGHHARDSIYLDEGYDNFIEGEDRDTLETEFTREVPGNFGGKVMASAYMDLSRRVAAELLRAFPDAQCVNCSDGARIDGATRKAAAAVRLDGPAGAHGVLVDRIEAALRAFPPGGFLAGVDLAGHARRAAGFQALADELGRAAEAEDRSPWRVATRLNGARQRHADAFPGLFTLVEGSWIALIRVAAYREARISDPAVRDAFNARFARGYRAAVSAVAEDARRLLDGFARRADAVGSRPP